jgi:tRNA dimethylallyltransferase
VLEGLSPAPGRDESLRARLTHLAVRRPAALHRFLRKHDPQAAARIHPNDHHKSMRAVELTLLGRQPATKTQSAPREHILGSKVLKIGLDPDRESLYKRLDRRTAWMFSNGLLEETQALLDSGFAPTLKPLQSLGYKQSVKVLTGQAPIAEAVRECQTKTRQYAKRQMTWFRREVEVRWLHGFGTDEAVQNAAAELTRAWLAA